MAGIYLHIPFCKKKCHYCDFHFSTKLDGQQQMVEAIINEAKQRKDYLPENVKTIYFGGGTPSLLSKAQLDQILQALRDLFDLDDQVEITFECNPDDLTKEKLVSLKNSGVNRLSIGIQSFDDDVLSFMNRAHNADEAIKVISLAQDVGFDNITADLIYGVPDKSFDYWKNQVELMLRQNVQHISAYCLTIEPKTVFGHKQLKGQLKEVTDEESLEQFNYLKNTLAAHGFEQYEISNFAKDNYISKHNSAYWLGKEYLGLGPSAHSYNIKSRAWNISNNALYVKKIKANAAAYELEELSDQDKFNDYILTRLRTKWGIVKTDLQHLSSGLDLSAFNLECQRHLQLENLIEETDKYKLSEKGKFLADGIAGDLFI
jgi:oxygen-independent coproporphyrinogen-3 oxidase